MRTKVCHFLAWFPYRCICRICRVCRTKKNHRTDRIHSISYKKLYVSFLLYWAFVREVSIKLYLSYEFFSYDRHDRYDRYNDMETRLFATMKQLFLVVSNSSSASNAKTLNRCRKNENSASCVYVVLWILNLSNFMSMLNSERRKKNRA